MSRRLRLAALLSGVAAAVLLLLTTRALDAVAPPGQLGPGFWPRLVLIGLALACVLQLVVDRGRSRPAAPAIEDAAGPVSVARLALGVACILAYVVATPLVGFPLATAGFIAVFMVLGGARRVPVIAVTAVAGTVVLLYTFIKLVYLPFPKGAGAFERVTLALYRALGIF